MGIGEARVGRRGEQKRRWDRKNRPTCPCGRSMSPAATLCATCHREAEAMRRLESRRLIVALWQRGLTGREIAEEVHMKLTSLWVEINRMRQDGWDLPHRRARRAA